MKKIFACLFLCSVSATWGQELIKTNNSDQVFYSLEQGELSRLALDDWDIAIEPQNDFAIRINEATGTRAWLKTDDIRDNCTLSLNCRGLQDYQGENIDTTGMLAETNSWQELHNSYVDWKIGALNNDIVSPILDLVSYGWGGYRAFSTNPAHAIIGYHIFIIRLRNGDYKQFFVRKSLSSGFEYAYANLDGSEMVEVSINRDDYENKLFSYRSLINHLTLNPEPPESEWDLLFTPYTPNKSNNDPTPSPGILHHINRQSSVNEDAENCAQPTVFNPAINTIGNSWFVNNAPDPSKAYFVERANGQQYFLKVLDYQAGSYTLSTSTFSSTALSSTALSQNESCFICQDESVQVVASGGACDYSIVSWLTNAPLC